MTSPSPASSIRRGPRPITARPPSPDTLRDRELTVLGVSGIVSSEDAQADAGMTGTDGKPYQTADEARGCQLSSS